MVLEFPTRLLQIGQRSVVQQFVLLEGILVDVLANFFAQILDVRVGPAQAVEKAISVSHRRIVFQPRQQRIRRCHNLLGRLAHFPLVYLLPEVVDFPPFLQRLQSFLVDGHMAVVGVVRDQPLQRG